MVYWSRGYRAFHMKNEENTSQQHGNDFENLIRTTHMFAGACNVQRNPNDINDIEARHDKKFGLITSVKAVKKDGWVGLADATRFYEINIPRRFIVGEWIQVSEEEKIFTDIHEIILPYSVIRQIRGDLMAAEVLQFHNRIAECSNGPSGAKIARAIRDEILEAIKDHTGIMRFEFKIDDYKQRRLQLSVKLGDLIAAVHGKADYQANGYSQPLYTHYDSSFCQYRLPFPILSPSRKIAVKNDVESKADKSHTLLFEDAPIIEASRHRIRQVSERKKPKRQDQMRMIKGEGMDEDLQQALFG